MGGIFKFTSSESGEHFPCFKRNVKHKVTPLEMAGSDDLGVQSSDVNDNVIHLFV